MWWASTGNFDIKVMLREVCAAAAAVFDIDGVGVMTIDGVEDSADLRARFLDARGALQNVEQLPEVLAQRPCQDASACGRRSR